MKAITNLTIHLLLGAILTIGCSDKKAKNETTAKEVKKEVTESIDEATNIISDEYRELLSNIDHFIIENNNKINAYKDQIASLDEDIKDDLNTKLSNLDTDIKKLEQKKNNYENAANEKKEDIKKELINLKDALDSSIKLFEKELREKKVIENE